MNRTLLPGPRTGAVRIPASKSQAHRMLICAALSRTPGHLMLDGFSEDIEATMQCLRALGAKIEAEADGLTAAEVADFQALPGSGLKATLDGQPLCGGNADFVRTAADIPAPMQAQAQALAEAGKGDIKVVGGR